MALTLANRHLRLLDKRALAGMAAAYNEEQELRRLDKAPPMAFDVHCEIAKGT